MFLLQSANELPLESNNDITSSEQASGGGNAHESTNNTTLCDSTVAVSNQIGEDTSPNEGKIDNKAGFEEVHVPTLTQQEINGTLQTWIQFIVWMMAFIPGFALKYIVSPVMSAGEKIYNLDFNFAATTSYAHILCSYLMNLY